MKLEELLKANGKSKSKTGFSNGRDDFTRYDAFCGNTPSSEKMSLRAEFKQRLLEARAIYQRILNPTIQ